MPRRQILRVWRPSSVGGTRMLVDFVARTTIDASHETIRINYARLPVSEARETKLPILGSLFYCHFGNSKRLCIRNINIVGLCHGREPPMKESSCMQGLLSLKESSLQTEEDDDYYGTGRDRRYSEYISNHLDTAADNFDLSLPL